MTTNFKIVMKIKNCLDCKFNDIELTPTERLYYCTHAAAIFNRGAIKNPDWQTIQEKPSFCPAEPDKEE